MSDLSFINSSQPVQIIGSDSTGLETYAVDATPEGRLKVDTGITSGTLVPTITKNFRVRYSVSSTSLPNTGAYQTLYTRSGVGLFFGFQIAFNHSNVNVRLSIDGSAVFTMNLNDLRQFSFNDTTSGRMQMGGFFTTQGNVMDFSSRYAIPYDTSVLLEVAVSDGVAHSANNWIVLQTED